MKRSVVLIGGEPGIGKSTLSLQMPLLRPELKTLYVTGEESVRQVKMRADRLGGDSSNCFIYSETLMENILSEAESIAPDLMIVDSVQTMYSQNVESTAGSVTQIKETASSLKEVEVVLPSEAVLIGSDRQLDDEKQNALDELLFRIEAVKTAETRKYVLMNVPKSRLKAVLAILPGIKSPTVLPLADDNWCSVHSVIEEKTLWTSINALKAVGAEGILVLNIEEMVP